MNKPSSRMHREWSSAARRPCRVMARLLGCALVLSAPPALAAPGPIDFSREILPILSQNCFTCHGPDSQARKADLRLDVKESALRATDAVIVPGNSGESELIARISSRDPAEVMPPPKSGKKLSSAQIDALTKWVDQGARWNKHWAFEPIRRGPAPAVQSPAWASNPIDRFVLRRLEAEGLAPSPPAEKAALLRRVHLDLTGLPPLPEAVDAFLLNSSTTAYEQEVDRLLASPHYGERMAMDWLDAARFADTNGFQNDFARTMWPWRDWVIIAYNRNQPFDRFLTEQVAGDLLPAATLAQRIATGFNRNNRTVTEAGSIDEEYRVENAVDRVETTSTVFLGLTMGCARCHEHKFDPISQAEFYQFLGFFNSVNEKGVYTETRGNVPPLIKLPTSADHKRLGEIEIAVAAAKVIGDKKLLDKINNDKAALEAGVTSVMVMEDMPQPRPTFVLKRGRYDMPDATRRVEPGVPASLPPLPKGAARNRLGLAQWLTAAENPLTARVAVNRIWQHHFGTGLVKTAENFGIQGESPSHPELLDWLASELVRTGWNLKAMHRLMVTSATYRQASRATPALLARDPDNRLLARGPRFRLPAEVVRDNALAIAGLLVKKVGGPSVKPYQPSGLWEELAGGAGEGPYVQDKAPRLYYRSLYVYRKRTVPHPVLASFDASTREVCEVKRPRTNTPLQALELLNDLTYVEAARHLAELMLEEGGQTAESRLSLGFRRALARLPSAAELLVLKRGLERYTRVFEADEAAARSLLNVGESASDPRLNPAVLAAYTQTAGVILNLDETITLE
jgi:hypothetical protein